MPFKLKTQLKPKGDQPKAIKELIEGLKKHKFLTLLGVTGSGKTFTIANLIAHVQKPTLVISHNKTLTAQLYREFKEFFPDNAVHYFVSYYDYYQPEAYIPQTDTYIEKDASINEELDKLRLAATASLLSRDDVIVVASVSCIYNIGSPEQWGQSHILFKKGDSIIDREKVIEKLVFLQYKRGDFELSRGRFRVRGDRIDIFPTYEDVVYRIELFDSIVERIYELDPISLRRLRELNYCVIYPAKYFVIEKSQLESAIESIKKELRERVEYFRSQGKLLEAQRLCKRVLYDIEMMLEVGYCHGIENYSRHFDGRLPGQRPWTLLDYFPKDFLLVIDESHVTVPQLRAMHEGDHSRKVSLVDYGFRLPSCFDNRPLKWEEFEKLMPQTIFVSATPAQYEVSCCGMVVEQIIRPTGLLDPVIEVKNTQGQIDDLILEIRKTTEKKQRVLVNTLTKRMAEDLCDFFIQEGLRVRYLHSEIDTIQRVEILRSLRLGDFDVLVGVNLLREGLDLPEVSLVAILDADKEGFLRSKTTLIQLIGRCARNIDAKVIFYADRLSDAMQEAIKETERRRKIQMEYNKKHNIKPQTIKKEVFKPLIEGGTHPLGFEATHLQGLKIEYKVEGDIEGVIEELKQRMKEAADRLDFEEAAFFRDEIFRLKQQL